MLQCSPKLKIDVLQIFSELGLSNHACSIWIVALNVPMFPYIRITFEVSECDVIRHLFLIFHESPTHSVSFSYVYKWAMTHLCKLLIYTIFLFLVLQFKL